LGITFFILLISASINPNYSLNKLLKLDVQKISLAILILSIFTIGTTFILKNTPLIKNNYILKRLTTFNLSESSAFSRIVVSKTAIQCFTEKPIFG